MKIIDKAIKYLEVKLDGYEPKDFPCYISTGINNEDESIDYCFECAEKRKTELQKTSKEEIYVGEEINPDWSDTTLLCDSCGERLKYCLSPEGKLSELEQFLSNDFDLNSKEVCYCLMAVFDDYKDEDIEIQKGLIKLAKLMREVIKNNHGLLDNDFFLDWDKAIKRINL